MAEAVSSPEEFVASTVEALASSVEIEEGVAATETLDVTIDIQIPLPDSHNFVLPCGITLLICRCDILKTQSCALATGECKSLAGRGQVSQRLLRDCPDGYRNARRLIREENVEFEYGKVYSCASGKNETSNASIAFDTVYHAIVPRAWFFYGWLPTLVTLTGKWNKYVRQTYKKLFQKAEKDNKSSLALPLFGCGSAGNSVDKAIEPLVLSLMSLGHRESRSLRSIIVYVMDVGVFTKLKAKIEGRLRSGTQTVCRIPVPAEGDTLSLSGSTYNEAMSRQGSDWVYKMESTPRGKALIIDNETFEHPEFSNRNGTQRDCSRLYNLFHNKLNFAVKVVRNCKAKDMLEELQAFSRDESLHEADSCMVAILSHGGQGDIIYGVDGRKVNGKPQTGTFIHVQELQSFFTARACPAMKDKPKLFIGQFCRGGLEDPVYLMRSWPLGRDAEKSTPTPDYADMYFLYAAVPSFTAYRECFVRILCEVFQKHAHSTHIKDLATMLHNAMGQMELEVERDCWYLTMSEERGTLRKNWYLNPPPCPSAASSMV